MIKNDTNASDLALEATGAKHKKYKISAFSATESELDGARAITLEIRAADCATEKEIKQAALALSSVIKSFIPPSFQVSNAPVTVICIGNASLTADMLGSLAAEAVIATRGLKTDARHIFSALGGREISVLNAKPASLCGIDAAELALSCIKSFGSRMIIAVDALKASMPGRLYSAVQVSDKITPGSGIGNSRPEISGRTLGVPVIAIGVPTAISAAQLISNALSELASIEPATRDFEGNDALANILEGQKGLLVSPIDGDISVKRYAKIIASAINYALIGADTEM